jgi:hypothetical protein
MTNAQRQRLYRERHLGVNGDVARTTLYLCLDARDALYRLAWHYCYSLPQLVEALAAAAKRLRTESCTTFEALAIFLPHPMIGETVSDAFVCEASGAPPIASDR